MKLRNHCRRQAFLPAPVNLLRAAAAVLLMFCLWEAGRFFVAIFPLPRFQRHLPASLCATAAAAEPGQDLCADEAFPSLPAGQSPPPVPRDPFALAVPEALLPGRAAPCPLPAEAALRAAGDRTAGPALFDVLPLDYLDAGDLQQSLKNLRLKGHLAASGVSNALLYAGTPAERDRLRALIRRLDVPGRQVTLQATILAVNRSDERELGIHWTWDTLPQYGSRRGARKDGTDAEPGGDYNGHLRLWPASAAQFRFNAALHALLTTGKARVLATPSLITLPGKEASIFIGSHIPVVTEKRSNGESSYATEYVDAGIKLMYLPFVGKDGLITSRVHTEVSTPVLVSELKNYRINSRTADTTVRMKNGETLAIGGLVSEEEQRQLQQIPLLAKLPLLGELFKYRFRSRTKTEVILLLTPYLTDAGQSPAIYDPTLTQTQPAGGPNVLRPAVEPTKTGS